MNVSSHPIKQFHIKQGRDMEFCCYDAKEGTWRKSTVLEQLHPSAPYTWQPVVSFSYETD